MTSAQDVFHTRPLDGSKGAAYSLLVRVHLHEVGIKKKEEEKNQFFVCVSRWESGREAVIKQEEK